jgi:hypothetical protein
VQRCDLPDVGATDRGQTPLHQGHVHRAAIDPVKGLLRAEGRAQVQGNPPRRHLALETHGQPVAHAQFVAGSEAQAVAALAGCVGVEVNGQRQRRQAREWGQPLPEDPHKASSSGHR